MLREDCYQSEVTIARARLGARLVLKSLLISPTKRKLYPGVNQ
jgi:hypothetical protein